jgi:hypothetical protein
MTIVQDYSMRVAKKLIKGINAMEEKVVTGELEEQK